MKGLSNEVVAKLTEAKPESIGIASRISGITPAAISILLVHLKKHGLLKKARKSNECFTYQIRRADRANRFGSV